MRGVKEIAMIKLIVVPPREWVEGEVVKVKVLRVAQYLPGKWELVIKEVEEVKDHEPD